MVGSSGPVLSSNGIADLQFVGRAHVRGSNNTVKQMLLTVNFLGLQIVWSTEMAYASPYLLSLGLSKAGMSAVFLAGPLSGLIVQPIIGAIADRSTSRFGRRRPVIVIGCVLTIISLLVFGYTREVASIFTRWGSSAHTKFTIFLAVLAVYALDFAINGIMAVNRALIVDVLPVSQQEEALAWGTRMVAVGSILGFWVGNVDLVPTFGFLGSEQIKILSVFASLSLAITHAITVFSVEERVLLPSADELQEQLDLPGDTDHPARALIARIQFWRRWQSNPILDSVKQIWHTYRTLPEPIWDICKVQAFAWGGWFPMLFFSSTYVAEIYAVTHATDGVPSSIDTGLRDSDPGTRAGSRALFLQSIVAFTASVVIPFCVVSGVSTASNGRRHRLVDEQGTTYALSWSGSSNALVEQLLRYMPTLPFQWLDLTRLWLISHIAFAVLMFATWFVGAVWSATTLLTVLGLCWTVTMWAPGSLLATEILQASGDGRRGAKSTPYTAVGTVDNSVEEFALQPSQRHASGLNGHAKSNDDVNKSNGGLGIVGMPNVQPATPLRTYFSDIDENGKAAHPPPLDIQHNLSSSNFSLDPGKGIFDAGNASPFADGGAAPASPTTASRSRTLQLRHSPSRSSISSSEDDYDTASSSYITPVPESQLINPFDRMLRSHSSLSGTASGENTPRRRASPMPPAMSRTSSGMRPSLETVRPSPAVLRDADLSTEEADLAREQDYLAGGSETRTADQAGAIMGIANIFVVLPQFMTSFISSIVFAFFGDPATASISKPPAEATPELVRRYSVPRSALAAHEGSNDSIGFVFRIGGVSALVAAWFCWQMRKRKQAAARGGSL